MRIALLIQCASYSMRIALLTPAWRRRDLSGGKIGIGISDGRPATRLDRGIRNRKLRVSVLIYDLGFRIN
jgi:hypothetical protein